MNSTAPIHKNNCVHINHFTFKSTEAFALSLPDSEMNGLMWLAIARTVFESASDSMQVPRPRRLTVADPGGGGGGGGCESIPPPAKLEINIHSYKGRCLTSR